MNKRWKKITRRSPDRGVKREFSFNQIDLISSTQSKVIRKIMKQTMNANSVAIEFMNKVLHPLQTLSKLHARNRYDDSF